VPVNILLLVLQWIVSLIAVFGGIGVIIYWAMTSASRVEWPLGQGVHDLQDKACSVGVETVLIR
jgi:hypothetical protein